MPLALAELGGMGSGNKVTGRDVEGGSGLDAELIEVRA